MSQMLDRAGQARGGARRRLPGGTSSSPPIPRTASSASSRRRRGSRRWPSRPTWAGASACSPRWGSFPRRWWESAIRELLEGAARDGRALPLGRAGAATRPAVFAALQYLADTEAGAPIQVMMPYSDRLRDVADWFRQLWAESLGKQHARGGEEVFAGPTPVKALGATDQHSQVQLYVEGPFDKTLTFLVESAARRPGDPRRLSRRSRSWATSAGIPWASCSGWRRRPPRLPSRSAAG